MLLSLLSFVQKCCMISVLLQLCVLAALGREAQHLAQAAAVTSAPEESSSAWNMSGDPCSGAAADGSEIDNPGIKCDCTFDDSTTCHIIGMKVYALEKGGELPNELSNLTYLTDLNLGQNYFSGTLPGFLGKLTHMQYLSFGINNFTGPIPKELGNLRKLITWSFSSNKFNGTLPEELGNLTELQEFYIASSGASGAIPPSFWKLRNLKKLWASDNNFTGAIPEFIGSWRNLTQLRLQGTGFQGLLPLSFSNLTSLETLRISDINSGVSSLDLLRHLTKITQLALRNNRISGKLPSFIGELKNLKLLDLSFNNFTGTIPVSLLNLNSLQFLFLGNNNISGGIPSNISSSINVVDLSYNNFSGNLPAWLDRSDLHVNLAGNNFQINEEDNRIKWKGLRCLQQTFPCNRGRPRYSSFAINCGGLQKTSSTGIVYERDNETLKDAAFYVSENQNWAVVLSGTFIDNPDQHYVATSQSQFTNTLDSELYQTARLSASSLRYYGLGLENGLYTVKLQFAEIQILGTASWKSLGRRFFDVYVQAEKVLTDFNIKKEAEDSNVAFEQTFKTNVTNNFLEIHFFWAGRGTCCIPLQATYGPLVSAISVKPEFVPTVEDSAPSSSPKKKISTGMIIGIAAAGSIALLLVAFIFCLWRRNVKRHSATEVDDLKKLDSKVPIFSLDEIRNATRNFHDENKLGQGAYGGVYKGILPNNKPVAVKQLSPESRQGKHQFMTEVATISTVRHRNLVKLYGCCIEADQRILVYEYLENNSLDRALFGHQILPEKLDWPIRYNICVGIARGLAYLHEESDTKIIHRDVKASNILLDALLNPKISDFGLAKLFQPKDTHLSTRVAGTIGYLAPEYAMRGHLTEKADVFSFGVVCLEIVSGRRNEDTTLAADKSYLLEWTWNLYEEGRAMEIMDPILMPTFSEEEVVKVIGVALLCTQAFPTMRPSMSQVVTMFTDFSQPIAAATRPSYLIDFQYQINLTKFSEMPSEERRSPNVLLTPSVVNSIIGEGR